MSAPIRIQICNERFLARFGVDRILLQAARYFQEQGACVSLAALRYDPGLTGALAGAPGFEVDTVAVPPGLDMQATEKQTTQHVLTRWLTQRPDVLVIGGWPFFDLASKAAAFGIPSCFLDAGAVPHENLSEQAANIQQELRRIRALTLPFITTILPISDFIRVSQTERDRGHVRGVRTVLLGADHLVANDFQPAVAQGDLLTALRALKAQGSKLVLNLGRFEAEGYKNSLTSFAILRGVREAGIDARLIVLAHEGDVAVPPDLAGAVLTIGHPSDATLLAVMREAALGLTTSLWEGFNLPLAEMQTLGTPVLAFVAGAHPEIIADPWFLCTDTEHMVNKARRLLRPEIAEAPLRPLQALARYRDRLTWRDTLQEWWREMTRLARPNARAPVLAGRRLVLVDLSNSCRDPANSGVIRVSRQLTKGLQRHPGIDVVCVRWDHERGGYTLIDPQGSQLSGFAGPRDPHGVLFDASMAHVQAERLLYAADPAMPLAPVLFLPEICLDGTLAARMRWARDRHMFVSAILYDLIAHDHREYCTTEVIDGFTLYLPRVTEADQIIAISDTSLTALQRYADERRVDLPADVQVVWLPAQFSDTARRGRARVPGGAEIRILCVSTIEPRKNHRRLVAAFTQLVHRRPDLRLRLTLVGNRYVGADELAAQIAAAGQDGIAIEWRGILSDQELLAEYASCRFTVYPSVLEGFGLPIMESLWLGKPVICSASGVMAELARPGGCLTTDVTDVEALSHALERLATDDALLTRLTGELAARALSGWEDYAAAMGDILHGLCNPLPFAEGRVGASEAFA